MVGRAPISYVIPFIDPHFRWVSVMNNLISPDRNTLFSRRAREIIQSHRGPMMALQAGADDETLAKLLTQLSLVRRAGDCAPLYSNLGPERYRLCPVELQTVH